MSFRGPNPGLSPSSLAPGTQLNGTYEIGDLISAGGMGEVYRGHNIATGDPVAIKVVLPEYAADTLILELFRKEARILYQLYHDAIVRYYGFASDRDLNRSYMAMEFVEGPSLAARLQQGPLPVADVVGLKTRLADGLQRAHELGIIHRDISPENVILQGGHVSRAKIIDFGIAKSSALAGEGTLIGTAFAGRYNYASPEQVGMFRPQTVSVRSDIYSLGLVLAAALRGTPIDMSGSMAEIMEKRMSVPDLSEVPPGMQGLLAAMLEPNPEQRIATMAEVRDWPVVGGDGLPIQPPRPAPPPVMPASELPPLIKGSRPAVKPVPSPQRAAEKAPRLTSSRAVNAEEKSSSRLALWIGIAIAAVMLLGAGGGWYYVKSKFPQQQAAVTAEPPQALAPPAAMKAPTVNAYNGEASPAQITGTWDEGVAKSLLVSLGQGAAPVKLGKDPGLVSDGKGNWRLAVAEKLPPGDYDVIAETIDDAGRSVRDASPAEIHVTKPPEPKLPPAGAPAPGSIATALQMSDFIAAYNGGPCFFAWPRELRAGAAKISVFAFDTAAFEGFYEAFKTASGFDPAINVHKINESQCPAIDAIKQLVGSKAPVPALTLAETTLAPGGVMVGEMKDILPGKKLEILRVDELGHTFRLTGLSNGGVFTAKVGQPGTDTSTTGPLPQLAILLSSPQPLQALSKLDGNNPAAAADVFPALAKEAAAIGRVSVAVQYFVLKSP